MAECEHLARTSSYFDGALAPADEPAAVAHLARCAACQALLGDAIGIDVALAGARRAALARPRWVRRVALVGAAAAAAGVALWLARARPEPPDAPPAVASLELPRERALEARFTGARFAPHRALGVLRGDRAREPFALAAMAELERRGELHDLVAALASSGDAARAAEVAAKLPADAAGETDRAAVALAAGDLDGAMRHAYRAIDLTPQLVAGHWNLALAARAAGLPRVARAEFARVVAAGELGWAAEAGRYVAALADEIAVDDRVLEVDRRGRAMVAGGAVLGASDVAAAPGLARVHFLDAVRVAADRDRLAALRPLAVALDAISGTRHAIAMVERADPAVGARFGAAYRALVERTATPGATAALLDALRAAGKPADHVRAGALISANQAGARWQELRAITAPWSDPWFAMVVERERILATWPSPDLRAEEPLVALLASCPSPVALRCGQIALELATLLADTGRVERAQVAADRAVELVHAAGMRALDLRARSFAAELHRRIGAARTRAEFEEVVLTSATTDCDVRRYARIGQAGDAIADGDVATARAAMPAAEPPPGCVATRDFVALGTAVDLARLTGAPADLAAAERWIESIGDLADGGFALAARTRIARGRDPSLDRALIEWIHRHAGGDATIEMARTWALSTAIADAGANGDWSAAFAIAANDHPIAAQAPCAVIASVDVDAVTVAVRAETTIHGAHRRIAPRELAAATVVPAELAAELRGCAEVAVVARPPLHGRADLLPAALPWWFAGDTPSTAPMAGPRRAIEVTDARPPEPALARLVVGPSRLAFDVTVAGADAVPRRVLAALADASYAELHVHGIATAHDADAAYLALSPDADGAFALRADAVRATRLRRAPLVVLAACRAGTTAPYLRQRWSLPDAFLAAGASGVVAVDVPMSDASARRVFDDLHRRIDAGEPVANAVAAVRAGAGPDAAWARRLMLFR